jgi:hypothetical protein
METTADRKLIKAKAHLKESIRELAGIIIHECEGHNDFDVEYWDTIKKSMYILIDTSKELN